MFIDETLYARIATLTGEADALAEEGSYEAAMGRYEEALELIPAPKENWLISTWVYTALGDVAFQSGDFPRAHEALESAARCPDALQNPFVRLRRGQALFDTGDLTKAEEELSAAYRMEGEAIFEDEDPKYLALVKRRLLAVPNGE